VIVCGSRRWQDRGSILERLAKLDPRSTIVHGAAARGADTIVQQEAEKLGLAIERHPADWHRHGTKAGPLRNEEMARLGAQLCIAFWDGRSTGTLDMMARAKSHGIPVEIVRGG
jgi:YspA, cpYpsA-related SLOG family